MKCGWRRALRWASKVALALAVVAVGIGFAALRLGGEAQAGAFFGSGAAVLAACLTAWWSRLRASGSASLLTTGPFPLVNLALRNGAAQSQPQRAYDGTDGLGHVSDRGDQRLPA